MRPARRGGPQLTVLWWGQIPSSVLARDGQRRQTRSLSARFQTAILRAATGRGEAGSRHYADGWHQAHRACSADLVSEVDAAVADLEARFDDDTLGYLVRSTRASRRDRHSLANDNRTGGARP
ncbi:MAG: virulence factor [Ornithinimicrobium sp.]